MIELMQAVIGNKKTNTAYKPLLTIREPRKGMAAAATAIAATFGVLGGLVGFLLGRAH